MVASTIYPAICAVRDQIETLEEIFVKSNRAAMIWSVPFCAGIVLFAPDLVEFVLGSEWEPAVVLLQGLAVATALQQLGFNWFSFYRARGDSRPQAVEAGVMAVAFLASRCRPRTLGSHGVGSGRGSCRSPGSWSARANVHRLFRACGSGRSAARGACRARGRGGRPSAAARPWAVSGRCGGAVPELVLFLGVTDVTTRQLERDLLRDFTRYLRTGT